MSNGPARRGSPRVLSAYVEGRLDRLFVNYVGADVTESQPLAAIYSPTLLNAEREYLLLVTRSPEPAAPREERTRLVEASALRLKRLGLTEAQMASLPP